MHTLHYDKNIGFGIVSPGQINTESWIRGDSIHMIPIVVIVGRQEIDYFAIHQQYSPEVFSIYPKFEIANGISIVAEPRFIAGYPWPVFSVFVRAGLEGEDIFDDILLVFVQENFWMIHIQWD